MSLFESATKTVNEAIVFDRQKRYRLAFDKYHDALSHFLLIMKYEKCPRSKQVLAERINDYLTRTENIKVMLIENKERNLAPENNTSDEEDNDIKTQVLRTKMSDGTTYNVKMNDIAGLDTVKDLLDECIKLPLLFPSLFNGNRKPSRAILLYGPAGTGKSMIAEGVVTESKCSFYNISSSDIVSKYQGESAKLIRQLFLEARKSAPSVIFLDEIDSMLCQRREGEEEFSIRIKTEFMVQMQGVGKDNDGILIIAATNLPWDLDTAIRRRFDKRIYIPLPDKNARKEMFKIHSGEYGNNIDFTYLAESTEGFSGSDINVLVNDALYEPIRTCQRADHFIYIDGKYTPVLNNDIYKDNVVKIKLDEIESHKLVVPSVTERDFKVALSRVSKSVSLCDVNRYLEWTKMFGTTID